MGGLRDAARHCREEICAVKAQLELKLANTMNQTLNQILDFTQ